MRALKGLTRELVQDMMTEMHMIVQDMKIKTRMTVQIMM